MQKKVHKQRITSLLLAFSLLITIGSFTAFAEQDMDINGDGVVDINDVTKLQMYLAGYNFDFSEHQIAISDINGDNVVDINDCTALQIILTNSSGGDVDNRNTYLLECENTDKNYSGTFYPLTTKEREYVEKVVTGEFGNSYTGAVCVAQCIRDALVYGFCDDPMDLGKSPSDGGLGYAGYEDVASDNAIKAVNFVFEQGGSAVQHRMLAMCTEDYYNSNPGNWHSTQNFIIQYQNVLFFDYWI